MPNIKKSASAKASELVQAKLTPGERDALGQLLRARASEQEARSEPGDGTFAGWLRWIIRREAKALGITVESAHTQPTVPAPPKKGRGKS